MTSTRPLIATLFLFISFAFPNHVSSQGTVVLSNFGAPGAITNSLTGQRAETGTTFSVALYFAPDGTTDAAQFVKIDPSINLRACLKKTFYPAVRYAQVGLGKYLSNK